MVFHAILFFIGGLLVGYQLLEVGQMLMRHGKMHIHIAGFVAGIHGPFGQMFFHGSAVGGGIVVKLQHAFGQGAVVKPLVGEKIFYHGFVLAVGHQGIDAFAFVFETGGIEVGVKGKVFQTGKNFFSKSVVGSA